MIDRIRFGYVIDFIYVKLINFAIFNIADSALIVGAILLSIYVLLVHEKYIVKLKDDFSYDLMIRQPAFVTKAYFETIQESILKKKNNDLLLDARYVISEPRMVCQAMHIDSYDSEPETFKHMQTYAQNHGYHRISKDHTEIYISDARKTAVDKLKTTLQFEVIK